METIKVWQMTEEERLAYIAKHPVTKNKKSINTSDYKWRGQKAAMKKNMLVYLKSKGFNDKTLKLLSYEHLTKLAADYHFEVNKKAQ